MRLKCIWQAMAVRNSFGQQLWEYLLKYDNAPGLHRLVCQMIFRLRDIKPGRYQEVAADSTEKVLAFLASTEVYPLSPMEVDKQLNSFLQQIFLQERARCDRRISGYATFASSSYGKGSQFSTAVEQQVEIALNNLIRTTGHES